MAVPGSISERLPNFDTLAGELDHISACTGARSVAALLNKLILLWLDPASLWYRKEEVAGSLAAAATALRETQNADGTITSVNLNSPPDTGFVVQEVSCGLRALRPFRNEFPLIAAAYSRMHGFLDRARRCIADGGIHTPNHRWVLCAALAALHEEFSDRRLSERIEQWLAEGIDIDRDGQFSERSSAIYSAVSCQCLVEVYLLTGRTHVLDAVRRNLHATLRLLHPDGRMETSASRRQDQFRTNLTMSRYYFPYRVMAILDADAEFSAAAEYIEQRHSPALTDEAIRFYSFPILERPMPRAGHLPQRYGHLFGESGLYRHRHDSVSASVFFGSDETPDPAIGGMASGRATSPNLVTFSAGRSSCRWIRVAPHFFGVGYLRPKSVSHADGVFHLEDKRSVAYLAPLDPQQTNAAGAYPLTTCDERYWSAISLDRRATNHVQELNCSIKVSIRDNECIIQVAGECTGYVPLWFEIAHPAESEVLVNGGAPGSTAALNDECTVRISSTATSDVLELSFRPEHPTGCTPDPRVLGDVDWLRLISELHEHASLDLSMHGIPTMHNVPGRAAGSAMKGESLRLLYAPFLCPGSATLTVRALP